MSLQINYKNAYLKNKTDNLVIFVDESFNILHLKKHLLSKEYEFINLTFFFLKLIFKNIGKTI